MDRACCTLCGGDVSASVNVEEEDDDCLQAWGSGGGDTTMYLRGQLDDGEGGKLRGESELSLSLELELSEEEELVDRDDSDVGDCGWVCRRSVLLRIRTASPLALGPTS